jgi:hypothetical protein
MIPDGLGDPVFEPETLAAWDDDCDLLGLLRALHAAEEGTCTGQILKHEEFQDWCDLVAEAVRASTSLLAITNHLDHVVPRSAKRYDATVTAEIALQPCHKGKSQ